MVQPGRTDRQARQAGLSVDLASLMSCQGSETEPELDVAEAGQAGLDILPQGKVSIISANIDAFHIM